MKLFALRGAALQGAFIITVAALALGGCFAPVSQREAQEIANARLIKYCNGRCGDLKLAQTQKIKDRWLVDFEAPKHKFTVTVETNGNTKVTTWDK